MNTKKKLASSASSTQTSATQSAASRSTCIRLLGYAKPFWPHLLVSTLAACVVSFSDAGITWSIKPVINNFHHGLQLWYIHWLPLLFIMLCILRGVANFMASYYVQRAARTIVMRFRQMLFRHLMSLPASYFDQQGVGKIISMIIYNSDQLAAATSTTLQTIMRDSTYSLFLLVVMFTLSWHLTLLLLAIAPFIIYFIKVNSQRLRRLSFGLQHIMGEVSTAAEEGVRGYKIIRLLGAQCYKSQQFDQAVKHNKQRELKMVVANSLNSTMIILLASIPVAIALFLATRTGISVGSLIAFIVASLNFQRPIRRLTACNVELQRGLAGAASLFDMLDQPLEQDCGTDILPSVPTSICFKQVGFNYPRATLPALQDINLNVPAGKMIALVGASGAGKSTIAQLLARFYEVTSGSIEIAGQPISDFSLHSLRQHIAMVEQETVLFNGTVRENLVLAQSDKSIDQAQLEKAAQQASALEFIQALPQGFDTLIGDNGVLLSGGQRQRLAIARAFLKDAPLLILDEATSSLDSRAEQVIQQAMERLERGRTSIVIAHRLSTIQRADCIYVLQQGHIVESGTHTELMQRNAVYAQLHRLQHKD